MCVCVAGVLEADGKFLGTRKSTVWYVAAPSPTPAYTVRDGESERVGRWISRDGDHVH
jgi:hypothetical protein